MEHPRGHVYVFAFLSQILKRHRMWEVLWQGVLRPGENERIPSSALLLQNFKVRPRESRCGSSQPRNLPSSLFVPIVLQVYCPCDSIQCWRLTRVASTPACQSDTDVTLPPSCFLSSEDSCSHLEDKVLRRRTGKESFYHLRVHFIQEAVCEEIPIFIYMQQLNTL